jgi:phosphoribosylamine--glycine ligase
VVTNAIEEYVMANIIRPVIEGMKADGMVFSGFLYAGLMISKSGEIKVLEFNCRLGDPEAEVLLLRLKSDLLELCQKTISKELDKIELTWDQRPALGVILAAAGYPASYEKGQEIKGLENELDDCKIFQAGTALQHGKTVTNGGRVLCVCALANSIADAQILAYQQVKEVSWDGMFYRSDIGFKGIFDK